MFSLPHMPVFGTSWSQQWLDVCWQRINWEKHFLSHPFFCPSLHLGKGALNTKLCLGYMYFKKKWKQLCILSSVLKIYPKFFDTPPVKKWRFIPPHPPECGLCLVTHSQWIEYNGSDVVWLLRLGHKGALWLRPALLSPGSLVVQGPGTG